MDKKLVAVVVVVVVSLTWLISSATSNASKSVVTVAELVSEAQEQPRVRLGARVFGTPERIVGTEENPTGLVRFEVVDMSEYEKTKDKILVESVPRITVHYEGTMPDTLVEGRDVILEGDYSLQQFTAESLMTQCPSKYEPPLPESRDSANTEMPT